MLSMRVSSLRPTGSSRRVVVGLMFVVCLGVSVTSGVRSGDASSAGLECQQAADRFGSLRLPPGHRAPLAKTVADPELEVCAAAGSRTQRSCCTRTIERRLHQLAVDDAKQALSSSSSWRQLAALVPLSTRHREELRQQMFVAGNDTIDKLHTAYQYVDSECQAGCINRFYVQLADYIRNDRRSADAFNFRSHVAHMLDSLFATVYFRQRVQHRGGSVSSSSSSSTQVFQRQQQYVQCVAGLRRRLVPIPLDDFEQRLAGELERSLNVTRLLLDAFDVAADTITSLIGNLSSSSSTATTPAAGSSSPSSAGSGSGSLADLLHGHQCSRALTRLRHCALCEGHAELDTLRPCRSFCVNVARGCLAPLVAGSGLSQAWVLFVNVVSQMANSRLRDGYDVDRVVGDLPAKIENEIGQLVQTVDTINHTRISSECGHYAGVHGVGGQVAEMAPPPPPTPVGRARRNRVPKLMTSLRNTALALVRTQDYFARMSDSLCRADGMSAPQQSNTCWNGTAFDRYNLPAVPMNIKAQMDDNPEMTITDAAPETLVTMTTKLGNMTKMLHSYIPARQGISLHAFIPDALDSSRDGDYSGDADYGDYSYHGNNWYPVDDEDGDYGSGSGIESGDGDAPTITDLPSSVTSTVDANDVPTVTTSDIVIDALPTTTTAATASTSRTSSPSTPRSSTSSPYIKPPTTTRSNDKPVSAATSLSSGWFTLSAAVVMVTVLVRLRPL